MQASVKPSWRFLFSYVLRYRALLWIVLAVLAAELTVGPWLLPRIIPAHWYFSLYVPAGAAIKARLFANGKLNVAPDPVLGWRNQALAGHGQFDTHSEQIEYDRHGSRSYRGISEQNPLPKRALLFGDSRINGWTYVSNAQTINAWMEQDDADVESLNLATDLYGLDQIYLAMRETLPKYQPKTVIVGTGSDEDNLLDCHCIVFKENRLEHDLPLLKPRLLLVDNKLQEQIPPMRDLLLNLPDNVSALTDYLRGHDGCYGRFERFQRWEFTPLLASFAYFKQRVVISGGRRWDFGQARSLENLALASALIKAMQQLAEQHQTQLVFLLLPTAYEYKGSKSFVYGQIKKIIEHQSVTLVDGLDILRHSGQDIPLFHDDVHLTAEANHMLATALLKHMK